MTKEELFAPIRERYRDLKEALKGTDLERIRKLTLEVHSMVHPAEISGRTEKTIADYVLDPIGCRKAASGRFSVLYVVGESECNRTKRRL